MFFLLLISLTSYLAIIFNWKLLKKLNAISESSLLDETKSKKQYQIGFLHYAYLAFGGLIAGLGMFLILGPIRQNYSLNSAPSGIMPFFISSIIIGLGVAFILDGIKIQRTIMTTNTQAHAEKFEDAPEL